MPGVAATVSTTPAALMPRVASSIAADMPGRTRAAVSTVNEESIASLLSVTVRMAPAAWAPIVAATSSTRTGSERTNTNSSIGIWMPSFRLAGSRSAAIWLTRSMAIRTSSAASRCASWAARTERSPSSCADRCAARATSIRSGARPDSRSAARTAISPSSRTRSRLARATSSLASIAARAVSGWRGSRTISARSAISAATSASAAVPAWPALARSLSMASEAARGVAAPGVLEAFSSAAARTAWAAAACATPTALAALSRAADAAALALVASPNSRSRVRTAVNCSIVGPKGTQPLALYSAATAAPVRWS